eukprot:COSAG04_NODE_247_length_18901_cov_4.971014_3_plen_133_part_00
MAHDLAPPRAVCQNFGEDGEYTFALGTEEGEKAVPRRRIRDLVETQPIVPLQYSEWRALKIRSFGGWETEIRHLPAAIRRRLAFGVRMPRPTMVAQSSPFIKQCVEFAIPRETMIYFGPERPLENEYFWAFL